MGNGILRNYRKFASLDKKKMTMKDFEKASKIIKKAEKDDKELLKEYTDKSEEE